MRKAGKIEIRCQNPARYLQGVLVEGHIVLLSRNDSDALMVAAFHSVIWR